ncbi:hypothetical protein [Planomonospora sphaerica]|nr:hypothetical protein [Planomonospora sphaerica]
MTASTGPRVSVTMSRLRPTIFLPASMPWVTVGAEDAAEQGRPL